MMYGLQPTAANFYPRPPRGGRRAILTAGKRYRKISIHALRKEGDVIFVVRDVRDAGFLSTPSARRATDLPGGLVQKLHISIHALRKEGDR